MSLNGPGTRSSFYDVHEHAIGLIEIREPLTEVLHERTAVIYVVEKDISPRKYEI